MIPPLRAARAIDATALADLQNGAFDKPWTALSIARMISSPEGFAVIAGADAPVGFALARATAPEAELLILMVRQSHRRAGLGRALTLAVAAMAAARGADSLFLEVADDNPAARALYERLGFVETGLRRGYYRRYSGPPMDARVMRLNL